MPKEVSKLFSAKITFCNKQLPSLLLKAPSPIIVTSAGTYNNPSGSLLLAQFTTVQFLAFPGGAYEPAAHILHPDVPPIDVPEYPPAHTLQETKVLPFVPTLVVEYPVLHDVQPRLVPLDSPLLE